MIQSFARDETLMSENGLPAIHPGEFLGETLDELHISAPELARILDLPAEQVSSVVQGTSPITAPIALLLARALDQSAQYWLNLQAAYDLKVPALYNVYPRSVSFSR